MIMGPSGAGKSDLALRLICGPIHLPSGWRANAEPPRQATLVADDQVIVVARAGQLMARPPAVLSGKIEVRGVGIVTLDAVAPAETAIALAVALGPARTIERMPDEDAQTVIAGIAVPLLRLSAFEILDLNQVL